MGGASAGMASLPQAPPGPGRTVPAPRAAPPAIARVRRRRRPSGEPPPLPRHLNASGKWWLGLSAMVLVAWIVILATRAPPAPARPRSMVRGPPRCRESATSRDLRGRVVVAGCAVGPLAAVAAP